MPPAEPKGPDAIRAVVDPDKCQGYANCVIEADAIFDIDESGTAIVLVDLVPPDLAADAQRAAASCPSGAIRIEK